MNFKGSFESRKVDLSKRWGCRNVTDTLKDRWRRYGQILCYHLTFTCCDSRTDLCRMQQPSRADQSFFINYKLNFQSYLLQVWMISTLELSLILEIIKPNTLICSRWKIFNRIVRPTTLPAKPPPPPPTTISKMEKCRLLAFTYSSFYLELELHEISRLVWSAFTAGLHVSSWQPCLGSRNIVQQRGRVGIRPWVDFKF